MPPTTARQISVSRPPIRAKCRCRREQEFRSAGTGQAGLHDVVLTAIKQQSRSGELRRDGGTVTHNPSIEEPPVIVKKYANRRLYNTKTSTYVTLEHLCEMVKDGIEFESTCTRWPVEKS